LSTTPAGSSTCATSATILPATPYIVALLGRSVRRHLSRWQWTATSTSSPNSSRRRTGPLAIADEMTVHEVAERFADDTSYDEVQAPTSQRRAVGLARALQAGALYATAQSPSWDMDELKPVLTAHAAVTAGRQAAAVALREVLRELYPAALRAYLDPAEIIPLQILDAFPSPVCSPPHPPAVPGSPRWSRNWPRAA
jgi:hypothetical protein